MIKLLLFSTRFPPEAVGTARYTALLAEGLARRTGIEVKVLAPAYRNYRPEDADLPYAVRRVPGMASRFIPQRYWRAYRALRQALAELNPDLLWAANGMATRVAGMIADRLALPLIGTLHGTDIARRLPGRSLWTWIESAYQRRFYARADYLVANSYFTRDLAIRKGIPAGKVQVIHLGVPAPPVELVRQRARQRHPDLADRPLVLTVGRLVRQKGHRLLLQAMAQVLASRPQVLHLIVGDGPERQALAAQARRLGCAAQIRLTGRLPSETRDECYALARVFALTSHAVASQVEGLGFVFLEAAAWGLPALGTRHGGIPEAIQDGRTGFLVDPDPDQIAARLGQLLDDEALCRQLAANAYQRVREEFSLEQMIDQSEQVIQEALARR